jgi:hypothetical protein
MKVSFGVFLFCILISCNGLDDDSEFRYSHKSSFLISNKQKVYRFFLTENNIKIQAFLDNVVDGTILNETVYFLDSLHRQHYSCTQPFTSLNSQNLEKPFMLIHGWEDFRVFASPNEILLEKNHKKKTEKLYILNGAQYIFCNQGRLWVAQNRKVLVYDLHTGALIDTFDLQRDFAFADFNSGYNLWVYTHDSTGLYQKYFDTNAISAGIETPVNFLKIQYSKVLTRLYETEYTKNIELSNQNKLNLPNFLEEVHSFDMDFQESRLFYTRNDSLFLYDINSQKNIFLLANFGKIQKGLHFYSVKQSF